MAAHALRALVLALAGVGAAGRRHMALRQHEVERGSIAEVNRDLTGTLVGSIEKEGTLRRDWGIVNAEEKRAKKQLAQEAAEKPSEEDQEASLEEVEQVLGQDKPQKLCEISEKSSDYGMSFAFHTDKASGCSDDKCSGEAFLSSGVGKHFEAVAGPAGGCHCWAKADGEKNVFLFSHVPGGAGCSSTTCWQKYATALRIFKGGDGAKNPASPEDPENPSHWQGACKSTQLHVEDGHALGLPTASQLIHTLNSWDAKEAVDKLLKIVSVEDELSEAEAATLGRGQGSAQPADLRTVLGHISQKWSEFTADALEFLESLGADILDLLTGSGSMTILGTTFTTQNYYIPMGKFLLAGITSKSAMKQWYLDLSGGTKVGDGPGPNTKTYYGWQQCKDLLEGLGAKLESGQAVRQNELGMQILNGVMWPDAPGGERTIFLGANRENHAFVRPILADVLDNARGSDCDGSTCWSPAWLRQKAEWFLERDSFETSDFKWFTTIILHKVHMNIDLSEEEARAFADYMGAVILPIPFAESQVDTWLVRTALDIPGTQAKRAEYLAKYKAAIRAKWPERKYTEPEAHLIASAFLDSLQFAGGLSVPAVLTYVTALTHQNEGDKWPELKGLVLDEENIPGVLWETMRMYPAVAGFPWWEQTADGSWKHEIVNVARALGDDAVFSNPDVFHIRPIAEYEQKSIGWVDQATYVAGNPSAAHDSAEAIRAPHTHRCPGKDLSFQIMIEFLKAFAKAGPWDAANKDISINSYAASGHTLTKRPKVAMCWEQPSSCVHSWQRWFRTESGCVPSVIGKAPWCSRFKRYVPGFWKRCKKVQCVPSKHVGESLADTEKVAMQAHATCKQRSGAASLKAGCVCSYASSGTPSIKTQVQRCAALTNVAQDIAGPYSCVVAKSRGVKRCEVYEPSYLKAATAITTSWNSVSKWAQSFGSTSKCFASADQCCSQDYLTTKSAKCSSLTTSVLTDDWLEMPANLQGVFWLQKQGESSSLVSFGRTRDGCGISPGKIPASRKYPIRVGGDRGWSFATKDGSSFNFVEAVDLIYEFEFDSATDPRHAQIVPKVRNVLGLTVPPWLLSFTMSLSSNAKYPGSVVWQRRSEAVGFGADSYDYQVVQVIDGSGKKLAAFDEWVQYCEDPSKAGSSSPGYIWLHSYDSEPYTANTIDQELAQCPSVIGWVAPPALNAASIVSQKFGKYSLRNVLNDPAYDKSVFDDFLLVTTIGLVDATLVGFSGAKKTAAQRICVPTTSRPLNKFRAQENLAPSEEIDTDGSCIPGTAFEFGTGRMCAFLIMREIQTRDDMFSGSANTWALALKDKGPMTKGDYMMSFFGDKNKDGDDIYPPIETDWTKLYFQEGLGFDDMLETKLTIDLLGTHLVTKVAGAAPSKGGETAVMVCKLNHLSGFARKPGFARWGGDMYFSADGRPIMVEIASEDGSMQQVWADAPREEWEYAKWVHRATMMNAVTLIDHLWFAHLSVSNLLATVSREKLLPTHPLRRLLTVATFGTIEVNAEAGHVLLPKDQVLHRASPFSDWDAVHDAGEDAIKTYEGYFGPVMDRSQQDSFPQRLKDAPFYQDAPDLFKVIADLVEDFFGVYAGDWCAASTDLIKNQELRDFSRAMEDWLMSERPNRAAANVAFVKDGAGGAWTCAALKKLLKVHLFTVSGWHQHVGKVADLVRNPEIVGSSWAPGERFSRPRQAMLYGLVSASTGFIGVKMNQDFTVFFDDIPKSSQAKTAMSTFRTKLQNLQGVIDERNQARDIPYTRMHPNYAEISLFQ